MTSYNNNLSQSRLKELLHYNPDTGIFTNLTNRSHNCRTGDIAGCVVNFNSKKYKTIRINNISYQCHRLAWLYMTGSFPQNEIDHADGNGLNNKYSNLSDTTHLENHKNKRLHSNNTSGISGIIWDTSRNKWRAEIKINYRNIYLGRFKTLIAAAYARHAAEIKYGFHPNHGTDRPL